MPSYCPKCNKQFAGQSIGTHAIKCNVKPEELFWTKVQKGDGCWIWTGAKERHGYGHFRAQGKDIRAHRYAWELHYGQPFPAGMEAMHTCDNKGCVNPAHIRPGTHHENMLDCKAKDRHAKGRLTKKSTLADDIVRAIRSEYRLYHRKRGNGRELAKKYGVSPQVVYLIASGRTWRHIK